ncbi:MAG: hypothetical protein Q7R57_08385 [Dehalococcoidales bacterium]|nr:hypothetical protein [Dehalococcoidales bacterium]
MGKPKQKSPKEQNKAAPRNVGSKNNLSFDLLYQLSYMSVIAAGGVPRSQIFERAAQLPCYTAEYFRKVELACRRLKFDYAQACRYIGDAAQEEEIKGLLLRFSSSLLSGEPEAEFLAREAKAVAENYENEYGRKLEALKMWTDAYVSLILSAVLVIIIGVVSTMIWKIQTTFIMGMAFISILTTVLGVWLIYLMTPREIVVLRWPGSREQKLARRLFALLVPTALAVCAVLLLIKVSPGFVFLVAAALVFPVGVITAVDARRVAKRDMEVGVFLRSLGGVCAALGTTVGAALGRVDLDAIHTLKAAVKRLHLRLGVGIRTRLCWKKFIDETGSELANRSVGMFYDAIDLGGSAGQAGYQASLFASHIALMRDRRKTVSEPFCWLCIAMHSSVVVLLVFITEVIMGFAGMVSKAEAAMPRVPGAPGAGAFTTFNVTGLEYMHSLVLPLVLVYTIANAIAPTVADGGSRYRFLFNLGLTAVISGLSLIFLPKMAALLFSQVQM